jgi:hypothetical protein
MLSHEENDQFSGSRAYSTALATQQADLNQVRLMEIDDTWTGLANLLVDGIVWQCDNHEYVQCSMLTKYFPHTTRQIAALNARWSC